MSEKIREIPAPEVIDTTREDEVNKIADWLRGNALSLLIEHHLANAKDPLSIGPRAGKKSDDPINNYTTPPLNTVSTDIVHGKDTLFCTHGVVLPTTGFQNFGNVAEPETILIRCGSLQYMVNGTLSIAQAGDCICVDTGQELQVRSKIPTDYICFYGDAGREHVYTSLQQ